MIRSNLNEKGTQILKICCIVLYDLRSRHGTEFIFKALQTEKTEVMSHLESDFIEHLNLDLSFIEIFTIPVTYCRLDFMGFWIWQSSAECKS